MDLSFPVAQCPSLDTVYCRNLQLTFSQPLQEVQQNLHPLMLDLKNKQLAKCYLVPQECAIPKPKYGAVLLGGTFDYFHLGHQLLLLTALFEASSRILIGVTGDNLLTKKKNKQVIQSIQIRMEEIAKYIKKIKPNIIIEILEINDPFGPAIVRDDFDAIAVSIETKVGADKINEIRKQRNLKQLDVLICPLMSQTSKIDVKVSSSQTRQYILNKNKMNVEQFTKYRQKWLDLNKRLASHFKYEYSDIYTQKWWDRILHQYSEYWRFYHTNAHIFNMLEQFDTEVRKREGEGIAVKLSQLQLMAVELGIWFHDVEYVPSSKNNEELSADTAKQYLEGLKIDNQKGQGAQLIKLVLDSILSTKNHQASTEVSKILIDIDMSILDSKHQIYMQYAEEIKQEYMPVVKNLYYKKRIEFLESMDLGKVFYYRKGVNFKQNIQCEINRLKQKMQQL